MLLWVKVSSWVHQAAARPVELRGDRLGVGGTARRERLLAGVDDPVVHADRAPVGDGGEAVGTDPVDHQDPCVDEDLGVRGSGSGPRSSVRR